jgi:hypothetical protein
MLKIGTRVNHSGHGLGTIVAYNGQKPNTYAENNLGGEVVAQAVQMGLGQAIVNSLYDGTRFPYVIQYDSGYKDVYSLTDVTAI